MKQKPYSSHPKTGKFEMTVEIESFQGDILLIGKHITYKTFLNQIRDIEASYDRVSDNFIPLLCRRYGWEMADSETGTAPSYVYDRDIEKAFFRTPMSFS